MKATLLSSLFILHFLFQIKVAAQNARPVLQKEPAWITLNDIDYASNKFDKDAEDGYVDLAFEQQVSLEQQSCFYRKVYKIVSTAGVENKSDIAVNFDPAYEQLIFHSIRIIRDGKSLNKLQLSKFKIIQQEKELSMHKYDGSLTALLVLDDVRKGDVIESSYTIKGFNTIFNNKYSDSYGLQSGVPFGLIYYKLIVPANRSITIKNCRTNIEPVITKSVNATAYEWKQKDIAGLQLENKTPVWFNPYPSVMVSEYHNWNEVSTWANTLFPRNISIAEGLQKKIDEIKKNNNSNEERIAAALRFVQDDIRYMAIEMGESSHRPNNPNSIFSQRYGDCKDKSYLLVTMLNAMRITADPVLINTGDKKVINDWLPAPNVFNHCTVQVRVNGKVYWFDPTISYQRGSINDITYPDYQAGLVINAATTSLATIPFSEKGLTDTREIFDIEDMLGGAQLKVITKKTGSAADEARLDFSNNSTAEIQRRYKEFYTSYFDKVVADSLTYDNNDRTGTFTTTEYYTLSNIWKDESGAKKLPIYAFVISGVMTKPSDKSRTMPFNLSYPARNKEQIEINMPESWPVKAFEERVECPSFEFYSSGKSIDNKIILNYEYENLKDHVMPDDAPVFFSNYDYANKATGFQLTYTPPNSAYVDKATTHSSSSTEIGLFPKLYLLLGIAAVLTFMIRRQRQKGY